MVGTIEKPWELFSETLPWLWFFLVERSRTPSGNTKANEETDQDPATFNVTITLVLLLFLTKFLKITLQQ